MTMITKFKSKNLLGETRKEEAKRLLNAKVKRILEGKKINREEFRRGGRKYLAGTTKVQRRKRRKTLKKSGLQF